MCNQTVSLVAAELERWGIPTALQIFLREAAEKLQPPRALHVPFDHGYPLGEPHNVKLQLSVLRATLALFDETGPPPVLKQFEVEPELVGHRTREGWG